MGNASANRYWEAKLPATFQRPPPEDRRALEDFIKAKYVDKKWAAGGIPSPGRKVETAPPSGPTVSSSNDDIFNATEDPFSQEILPPAPPAPSAPAHLLDDLWAAPDAPGVAVARNYENIERALLEPTPNLDPISAAIRRLDV